MNYHEPPPHLSYSQLSSYAECSERYRLERLMRAPSNTWWTTLMGTAIHEASAAIEQARWLGFDTEYNYRDLFMEHLEEAIADETRRAVHLGREPVIKASGRVAQAITEKGGGPNKKDRVWVEHFGPIFLERYMGLTANRGHVPLTRLDP